MRAPGRCVITVGKSWGDGGTNRRSMESVENGRGRQSLGERGAFFIGRLGGITSLCCYKASLSPVAKFLAVFGGYLFASGGVDMTACPLCRGSPSGQTFLSCCPTSYLCCLRSALSLEELEFRLKASDRNITLVEVRVKKITLCGSWKRP